MSMTVAPNLARPKSLEIRHLELSKNIIFEKPSARKGLQTVAQRSDQKPRKGQNSSMRW